MFHFNVSSLAFCAPHPLLQCLDESRRRVRVRFEASTIENLRVVVTKQCRVLHYSGHATPDQGLAFEDGMGGLHHNFSVAKLKQLFQAGDTRNVRLCVVAACNSEFVGECFVSAGVPHVVSVQCARPGLGSGSSTGTGSTGTGGETDGGSSAAVDALSGLVSDRAARVFCAAFYLALLLGKTVAQAFEIGRARVAADVSVHASQDSGKFLLLPRNCRHDEIIFHQPAVVSSAHASHAAAEDASSTSVSFPSPPSFPVPPSLPPLPGAEPVAIGAWRDVTPTLPRAVPILSEFFFGRHVELDAAIRTVLTTLLLQTFDFGLFTFAQPHSLRRSSLPSDQVMNRRLTILRGARGSGKSAFVAHLAAYLSDRRHFPVFVIDLHACDSVAAASAAVYRALGGTDYFVAGGGSGGAPMSNGVNQLPSHAYAAQFSPLSGGSGGGGDSMFGGSISQSLSQSYGHQSHSHQTRSRSSSDTNGNDSFRFLPIQPIQLPPAAGPASMFPTPRSPPMSPIPSSAFYFPSTAEAALTSHGLGHLGGGSAGSSGGSATANHGCLPALRSRVRALADRYRGLLLILDGVDAMIAREPEPARAFLGALLSASGERATEPLTPSPSSSSSSSGANAATSAMSSSVNASGAGAGGSSPQHHLDATSAQLPSYTPVLEASPSGSNESDSASSSSGAASAAASSSSSSSSSSASASASSSSSSSSSAGSGIANVKLLVVARASIGRVGGAHAAASALTLRPLAPIDALRMLTAVSPRRLPLAEFSRALTVLSSSSSAALALLHADTATVGGPSAPTPAPDVTSAAAVSRHPVFELLNGNAQAVSLAAHLMEEYSFTQLHQLMIEYGIGAQQQPSQPALLPSALRLQRLDVSDEARDILLEMRQLLLDARAHVPAYMQQQQQLQLQSDPDARRSELPMASLHAQQHQSSRLQSQGRLANHGDNSHRDHNRPLSASFASAKDSLSAIEPSTSAGADHASSPDDDASDLDIELELVFPEHGDIVLDESDAAAAHLPRRMSRRATESRGDGGAMAMAMAMEMGDEARRAQLVEADTLCSLALLRCGAYWN
jgi:hypothetical protein